MAARSAVGSEDVIGWVCTTKLSPPHRCADGTAVVHRCSPHPEKIVYVEAYLSRIVSFALLFNTIDYVHHSRFAHLGSEKRFPRSNNSDCLEFVVKKVLTHQQN